MGFIGGIVAGELWRKPVTGSTSTFLRFEEAAGLAGGLTDGVGMIHGANSRSQKDAHLSVGRVDWHRGWGAVSLACQWPRVAGSADRRPYDHGRLFLEHCAGCHTIDHPDV
jgi:hypothetical protein